MTVTDPRGLHAEPPANERVARDYAVQPSASAIVTPPGQGLVTELLRRRVQLSRDEGLVRIFLPDQPGMIDVAWRAGFTVEYDEQEAACAALLHL